jgi:flagellar biosynthesis/type III secretory pathway ATPase
MPILPAVFKKAIRTYPIKTHHAVARCRLTRFIGSEADLDQLRRARQLACDNHGQVVGLAAEAGLGKSEVLAVVMPAKVVDATVASP